MQKKTVKHSSCSYFTQKKRKKKFKNPKHLHSIGGRPFNPLSSSTCFHNFKPAEPREVLGNRIWPILRTALLRTKCDARAWILLSLRMRENHYLGESRTETCSQKWETPVRYLWTDILSEFCFTQWLPRRSTCTAMISVNFLCEILAVAKGTTSLRKEKYRHLRCWYFNKVKKFVLHCIAFEMILKICWPRSKIKYTERSENLISVHSILAAAFPCRE